MLGTNNRPAAQCTVRPVVSESHWARDLFARAFEGVDPLYRGFDDDGVLLVAVQDDGAIESYVHVPVDVEPTFATIGRHRRCDLVLAADGGASSRHAVLAARRVGLDEVRVRLWDLGTSGGIETELGHRCVEVATAGHLFVRLGRENLFCLPTGAVAPLPWGLTAAETWSEIPERVLLVCRPASRSGPLASSATPRATPVAATVREADALRQRSSDLRGAASPAGHLGICVRGESVELAITQRDLQRGLLIGRDQRCAVTAQRERVSRVHLMLVEEAEAVWAVDTASTHGTLVDSQRVRQARLGSARMLSLAGELSVDWSPSP